MPVKCQSDMIILTSSLLGISQDLVLRHLGTKWMDALWWSYHWHIQYIPRNMHTVFALLCFVVVIHWLIFTYPSGLLHWHCGNLTIAPVPVKQPWWIWINTSYEFIVNDCITTTKQSTTKSCAYFLGYTVLAIWMLQGIFCVMSMDLWNILLAKGVLMEQSMYAHVYKFVICVNIKSNLLLIIKCWILSPCFFVDYLPHWDQDQVLDSINCRRIWHNIA